MTNKDMALSRTDAMDRCISLGKKFIQHFDKIYKHPESDARFHWMAEMESWYKKVKEIKLKQSNDYILSGELRDWFFTAGANPQDFMQNPTNEELKLYDNFTNKLISGNNIQTALRSINIMDKKIKDTTITKTVDLGNYSRYDSLIMKKANDYSLKLDGTGHTVKVIGEPENINDFVQFINEYHRANAKILDSKSFMVKYMNRTFKVKAKDHQDAASKVIKKVKDNTILAKDIKIGMSIKFNSSISEFGKVQDIQHGRDRDGEYIIFNMEGSGSTSYRPNDKVVFKDSRLKDGAEENDKKFLKNAIEELEGYISNWSFMTAKQKQDIGADRNQLRKKVEEYRRKLASLKDSKNIGDERLSPMTYKKLKELGYDSEKWKGMTQEQANKIVQEGSKTENKPKSKEGARNNFKNLEKEETKSAFSNKPDYSKHSKEVQDVGELTEEYIKDIEENVKEYSSDDIEDLTSDLTRHIYRKLLEKYDMEESDVVDIMSEINRPFRELAEKPKKFDLKSFASNVRKNLFEAFREKGIK